MGDRVVILERWEVACQYCCLVSRASGTGVSRGAIVGANYVRRIGFFGRSHVREDGGTDHMRCWHRSTVCPEVVVCQR